MKDPVHAASLAVTNFSGGKRHTGRETVDQGAVREMACLAGNMRTIDAFPVASQEEKWGEKIPASGVSNEGLFRGSETDSSDDDSWLESSIVINGKSESVHDRSVHGLGQVSNPDSIFSRCGQLAHIARYVKQVQTENNGLPVAIAVSVGVPRVDISRGVL